MTWIKRKFKDVMSGMHAAARDDTKRKELMLERLNIILALKFRDSQGGGSPPCSDVERLFFLQSDCR